MKTAVVLKSLIQESKDGEWGQGEPFKDSVEMAVIRGTDFEAVRSGLLAELPIRHIPKRIANRKTLQSNDIVFETAGGSKDRPTGRSVFVKPSVVQKSELPLTCASFSRFIRIDPAKADPRYIFWHLQYLYEAGYLRQYHTQHTGVARFQYTIFSETEELLIPSLTIQRKIAAILSGYDDLIENNTRRIKILEEMARSLYREWFVYFRFPGHEQVKMVDSELGLIPEEWEVGRLDDALILQRGFDLLTKQRREGNVPVYASTGVAGTHNVAKVKAPGVVTGRSGSLGTVIYIDEDFWPLNTTLWVKEFRRVTPLYAFYLLNDLGLEQFNSGAAVPTLNRNDIHGLPVFIPSYAMLEQFNYCVEPLFALKKNLQVKDFNLQQTRDLFLPKLISGKIDVEKLNINLEEVA